MRQKLLQFGAALVLVLSVWGHVSELFDHWDNTFKTGNDVEYSTVLVVLIVGVVIGFVRLTVMFLTGAPTSHLQALLAALVVARPNSTKLIGHSPPLPLRI